MLTGVSDPVFSAKDQVAWFCQMNADTPNAQNFNRLFMVPGMNHCGGGQAFNDFDPLTLLENWHGKNQAPERMIAQGKSFPNKCRFAPIPKPRLILAAMRPRRKASNADKIGLYYLLMFDALSGESTTGVYAEIRRSGIYARPTYI